MTESMSHTPFWAVHLLPCLQVIHVNVTNDNPVQIATGAELQFTYDVHFHPTSTPFEQRFNRYLDTSFFEHKVSSCTNWPAGLQNKCNMSAHPPCRLQASDLSLARAAAVCVLLHTHAFAQFIANPRKANSPPADCSTW